MRQVIAWAAWVLVTWGIYRHDHAAAAASAVIGLAMFYAVNVRYFAQVRARSRA